MIFEFIIIYKFIQNKTVLSRWNLQLMTSYHARDRYATTEFRYFNINRLAS
jgi:hypothetical protein